MNIYPENFDKQDWRYARSYQRSLDLLKGSIDLHVHAGPHLVSSPRSVNPVQAAIEARDAGMRAIAYMCVFNWSVGTSWIVNETVPDFSTYGGIILNTVFGGMNPRAVKTGRLLRKRRQIRLLWGPFHQIPGGSRGALCKRTVEETGGSVPGIRRRGIQPVY